MLFEKLQTVGKALMLPVAVLPAAALLLRLGAKDVLDLPLMAAAGRVIFDNLPAIFAIGISFGLAKDSHGAAGLAGYVGYSIFTALLTATDKTLNMGVMAGIVTGLTAGWLYNRYCDIKLPEFLGFFGGRRFVPIVTSLAAIILAVLFGFIWPPLQTLIYEFGEWIISTDEIGTAVYGFANRMLIPFGLHHILNNLVFFVFGRYTDPVTGNVYTGDLNRFFAGDPTAGMFMAGGFPVMMFGLPAVTLAMYRTAKPENRAKIAGSLASMAFASFLTGITEPIEFSFMFLAPVLFFIHAVLMGLSMAVTHYCGVLAGASFSMGAIDYVLNWGISTHPERIIPIGIVFGAIYYTIFSWAIVKFDLPTLGRFDEPDTTEHADMPRSGNERIAALIQNLGGAGNFSTISACMTRLRLVLKNPSDINETELKKLGAKGVLVKGNAVQVVLGTEAENVANEIKKHLNYECS